jgi:hypothetical protein
VTEGAADVGADEGAGEGAADVGADENARFNLAGTAAVALVLGLALAGAAGAGAVALLAVIALAQAVLAFAWVLGLRRPGRIGALIIAALASGAADTVVSVWPHSRLGTLVAVLALAVPVLFVHQLSRGVVRVRVVESLGSTALLVVAEVSLAALMQLRHEFDGADAGADVVVGVVIAAAGALVVGCCTDLIAPVPRFDAAVPRGLPAVVVSTGVGAIAGYVVLHDAAEFAGGRSVFVGAAVGVVAALLAIATAFSEHDSQVPEHGFARRVRPVLGAMVPLAVLAPVAFLLCLAVRT